MRTALQQAKHFAEQALKMADKGQESAAQNYTIVALQFLVEAVEEAVSEAPR